MGKDRVSEGKTVGARAQQGVLSGHLLGNRQHVVEDMKKMVSTLNLCILRKEALTCG